MNSQSGGNLLLRNKPKQGQPMMNNGAVHIIYTIIPNVVSSSAKAEIVALYLNSKYDVIKRTALWHFQRPQSKSYNKRQEAYYFMGDPCT